MNLLTACSQILSSLPLLHVENVPFLRVITHLERTQPLLAPLKLAQPPRHPVQAFWTPPPGHFGFTKNQAGRL